MDFINIYVIKPDISMIIDLFKIFLHIPFQNLGRACYGI
jgi:hypothetical protein